MGQAYFTLDLERCTGCSACRVACAAANPVSRGTAWRTVTTFNPRRWAGAPVVHLSLACNHCAAPPCVPACPAGAYGKDPVTGAVLVDRGRCVGCRYCTWVCPYGAPRFVPAAGTVEKCTLCAGRLAEGGVPACAAACPTGALGFAPAGGESLPPPEAPGLPEVGTRPALRVLPRRRGAAPPETTAAPATAPAGAVRAGFVAGAAGEWPLLAFTVAATALVALFTADRAAPAGWPAWGFAALCAAAIAVSAAHLGRPLRAWRALAGVRSSWVSREVAAFTAFAALGTAALALPAAPVVLGWAAAACGVASLAAMDMVYRVRGQSTAAVPHSAMATLTWAFAVALLLGLPGPALAVGAARGALYAARMVRGSETPWPLALFRLAAGFGLPLAAWVLTGVLGPWGVAGVVAGELVDRAGLYAGLAFPAPERESRLALAALAGGRG